MKIVVFTLGCKVNEVESASIMATLEKEGFEVSDKLSYADAYVLNTCAVTAEAEKKSRQLIARARKFNPEARIFVCGCASEKDKRAFYDKNVAFVTGARNKEEIISAISRVYGCGTVALGFPKQTKTRAFIKIQDGCNNFCSYCIIPYLRGREKSRPIEDILQEINALSCPEVVLTGINISSYDSDGKNLADLVSAMSKVEKRVRFGSLECNVITEELLSRLKCLPDFAPQFHLSLQSGSDAVLKSMNRHYTRAEYLEKCALIYKFFPSAAITTDIIAGFPTETEEDFGQSLSIIGEAGFARVHAFAFSPREGTVAYKMKDLSPDIKKRRLHQLLEAAKRAEKNYLSRFIGTKQEFIAEECENGFWTGYTPNYIKVYACGDFVSGKKYSVKFDEIYLGGVKAVALNKDGGKE